MCDNRYKDGFAAGEHQDPEMIDQAGLGYHLALEEGGGLMIKADDKLDLETARLDPGSVFTSPEQLCESPALSREQKIDLLQRWADDARELDVAEAEGMGGGETSILAQILSALDSLSED